MSVRRVIIATILLVGFGVCTAAFAATSVAPVSSITSIPLASLQKRAATGNPAAEYALGYRLASSKNPTDRAKAIALYRKAAEQGNTQAEWALGSAYLARNWPGIEHDVPTGLTWMRKSLSEGSADHMAVYGYLLAATAFKSGNKQNMQDGMEWIRRGAKGGSAQGMDVLGMLLLSGVMDVTQDKAGAEYWLLKSAKLGNAKAQESLGVAYIVGGFGKPDLKSGLHWLRESATQGDVTAEGTLGMVLITGKIHVPKNPAEGVQWADKAIAKQDAAGYYALGFAYQDGSGEPVNPAKAWYNFAAALRLDPEHKQEKVSEARLHMSQVAMKLSATQLSQLQAEVSKLPTPENGHAGFDASGQ